MKILYYYFEQARPMDQWKRIHFIDELTRNGIQVDTFNPLLYQTFEEANLRLLDYVKKNPIDLFVASTLNNELLMGDTVSEINRLGIATLCLRFDNLVSPLGDKENGILFDLVWLFSNDTIHFYKKWGITTMFAPYAANPYLFKFSPHNNYLRHICFVGTPYGSRAIMINTLTKNQFDTDVYYKRNEAIEAPSALTTLKNKIPETGMANSFFKRLLFKQGRKLIVGSMLNKIIGQTHIEENEYLHSYPVVIPQEQCDIYSKCVLALASTSTNHTDVLKNPLKIVNLRNFEIPMSGGIEICKYNPELAEYFEDGKEIVFYANNDELVDKARYYTQKASDQEINQIKEAARARAVRDHTWMRRFNVAFDKLGLKV